MVLIELFDAESPIDNLLSTLTFQVERTIFFGKSKSDFEAQRDGLVRVLRSRGLDLTLEFRTWSQYDPVGIMHSFCDVIREYPDCVFDLTGGEDSDLFAAGMLQERYGDAGIPMFRMNPTTGRAKALFGELPPQREECPPLTIGECIALHGGSIVYRSENAPHGTIRWEMDPPFCGMLQTMQELYHQNTGRWNMLVTVLSALPYCRNYCADSPLTVEVRMNALREAVAQYYPGMTWYRMDWALLQQLDSKGVIRLYIRDEDTLKLAFASEQVRECLTRAGTVWELEIYQALRSLQDSRGRPLVSDCMTGVVVDWDGLEHADESQNARNEIDVLAIRGTMPVFISCKSKTYNADELYKLFTVALQFGGKYSRRLLCASVPRSDPSISALQERAARMGIRLCQFEPGSDVAKTLRGLIC